MSFLFLGDRGRNEIFVSQKRSGFWGHCLYCTAALHCLCFNVVSLNTELESQQQQAPDLYY